MIYSLEYFALFAAIISFVSFHIWRINRNLPIPNLPLLGMIPSILFNVSNIHEYATTALKHYGGTFKVRGPLFTNINFLITSDPMNLHHVTSKNFVNYGKGSEFHEIFDILGDGIFNSDSQKWKYQRNLLQSLFKQNIFENFVRKVIHKKLDGFLLPLLNEVSESRNVMDLQDIFQRFTFDSICSIVLAFDPNCLPNKLTQFPEVAAEKAFNKTEDAILYRHLVPRWFWKLQRWLRIGHEKDSIACQQILDKFLRDRISSSQEEKSRFNYTKDDESNFDMLKALVEKSGMEQVDHKFLRDTAINLLAAGRDTINSTFCWFFWLVSTHPNVETKILGEIKANFKTNEENWFISGMEDLDKLIYLHGAICEALRLFPPVPFEHKCAIKSDILPSGDRVDANTMVLYSIYSMGRMEQIWGNDCLEFKPERWISEKGMNIQVPSYKFMAFNAGPRSCLGKNISFIQLKIIAIALLWNFEFQVVEGHSVCPSVSIILHMKHGLQVRVTKRSN
ncbi:hypothetical protein PIB30_052629 [Stylosanthes scabra]|uniref:Cytochrome P450 n=1 Tax=Stylosanthes scabra TaxID=79078 RepID=A0ABU6VGR3_9FABA|nr:hypothetical protein [Stylosanthes scabra]